MKIRKLNYNLDNSVKYVIMLVAKVEKAFDLKLKD